MTTIAILTLFGIILVGLEVFLPGGILGIIGIGCTVAAAVFCFTTAEVTEVGIWLSFVMAASVVVVTGAGLYFWLKYFQNTGIGKRFVLDSSVGGETDDREDLVGEIGEVVNDLRPLGKILLGGKRFEARSQRGLIPRGTGVRVVKTAGGELIVRVVDDK